MQGPCGSVAAFCVWDGSLPADGGTSASPLLTSQQLATALQLCWFRIGFLPSKARGAWAPQARAGSTRESQGTPQPTEVCFRDGAEGAECNLAAGSSHREGVRASSSWWLGPSS